MARTKDHAKAVTLRQQGKSYSQIKDMLGVGKGTLSAWLKGYPLSEQRLRELRDWNEQRIEKFRETMRRKRDERLSLAYKEQKKEIFPLSKKEIMIAGLFLYWGEGSKTSTSQLIMSNTDPAVIKFFIAWATKTLGVPLSKFRVRLQLYDDMNIKREHDYWSKTLNLPKDQFRNPYIKKTTQDSINYKRSFGHGTCDIKIGDARLYEKVLMSIKAISERY